MPASEPQAPFAYEGLDRVFHEKARLGIVSSLAAHADGLTFGELKSLCGLTDGNLSRHLQVLDEAGYVGIEKGYEGKRPQTRCRLTDDGRARFADYLDALEQVLRRATQAAGVGGTAPALRPRTA
jgi:DNA-binding transcriptional ArsR family regulator